MLLVGGPFHWSDRNWTDLKPGGGDWPHYGRFLRIERPRLVEFTWMSEFTHGFDSVVTVTFHEAKGGTEVELRHSGLPDDQTGRDHQDAWIRILGHVGAQFPPGVSGADTPAKVLPSSKGRARCSAAGSSRGRWRRDGRRPPRRRQP